MIKMEMKKWLTTAGLCATILLPIWVRLLRITKLTLEITPQ